MSTERKSLESRWRRLEYLINAIDTWALAPDGVAYEELRSRTLAEQGQISDRLRHLDVREPKLESN